MKVQHAVHLGNAAGKDINVEPSRREKIVSDVYS